MSSIVYKPLKDGFLWISFAIASFTALFQSALFPHIGLLAYAPFLAAACMRASMAQALWLALFSGFCFDFLTSNFFGMHAVNFFLSTLLAHHFKKHFFREEFAQICFVCALISCFFTPIHFLLLFFLDQKIFFTWKGFLFDFLAMPFCDALYSFLFFVGPLLLYDSLQKQWKLWRSLRNHS